MQNLNHLVSLLQEGYITIGVVFSAQPVEASEPVEAWAQPIGKATAGPKIYTYKSHFDCMVGDLVVLPASAGKLPSIGQVVRVDAEPELNFESGIEYKWAVCKVDTSGYDKNMAREKELIKMLRDNERVAARKKLLESYQLTLPEDAEARKIFDQARQIGLHREN